MAAYQNVTLYTCITNHRDRLQYLEYRNDFRYVAFTDDPALTHEAWEVQPLVWSHPTDPVRTARYHKHHPTVLFPDSEISIWLDATHWPYSDLSPLLRLVAEHDIAAMRHVSHISVCQEAEICARSQLDDPQLIHRQIAAYRAEGFPDNLGLFSTACLVRRHTERLKQFQQRWWSEIEKGSRRDQLSFTYCLWRLGLDCAVIPGVCRGGPSPYFKMRSHYPPTQPKVL